MLPFLVLGVFEEGFEPPGLLVPVAARKQALLLEKVPRFPEVAPAGEGLGVDADGGGNLLAGPGGMIGQAGLIPLITNQALTPFAGMPIADCRLPNGVE